MNILHRNQTNHRIDVQNVKNSKNLFGVCQVFVDEVR